jgi:hypothetical protein
VELVVNIWEATTGAHVLDADVMAGPLGRPKLLPVVKADPYMTATPYVGSFVGYERSWEISVVRGRDVLRNVVLTGPSYPSISSSLEPAALAVHWLPGDEANVTADGCASQIDPSSDLSWTCCQPGHDGVAVLTSAPGTGCAALFPMQGNYDVEVIERIDKIPIGSQGGYGAFQLRVGAMASF